MAAKYSYFVVLYTHNYSQGKQRHQLFYGPLIQDNPGEPVLSQMRDLLEQSQDFYEPDVIPAAQPIVTTHYRKNQWFGRLFL